jgi:hypothetical protein
MLPSPFFDRRANPEIYDFVHDQVGMQFADAREMMKCRGFNFAATMVLCNLISGISVILYTPKNRRTPREKSKDRGPRFKELLRQYYPWDYSEDKEAKIQILYDVIRNPLTRSLGVLEEGFIQTSINKDDPPLTQGQIEELERSPNRPQWLSLAVECDNRTNKINVEGLYWGVLNLVRKLAEDTNK